MRKQKERRKNKIKEGGKGERVTERHGIANYSIQMKPRERRTETERCTKRGREKEKADGPDFPPIFVVVVGKNKNTVRPVTPFFLFFPLKSNIGKEREKTYARRYDI